LFPLRYLSVYCVNKPAGRLRFKCEGTRAETRFCLSAKRMSPFKSTGASVQSNTGSRGGRISSSNVGYTKFRGSVRGTGYPLHSPVSLSLSPPVRHREPSRFNGTLRREVSPQIPQFKVSLKPSSTKSAYYQRQRQRQRERENISLLISIRTYLDKCKTPFHVGKSYRFHTHTNAQSSNDRRSLFYLTNTVCHILLLFQFAVIQIFRAFQSQRLARFLFIVFEVSAGHFD
jgi:hypothetical protein